MKREIDVNITRQVWIAVLTVLESHQYEPENKALRYAVK